MATKASIAALMALVAACPKPAPAAPGRPIMEAQRGVGFGCPAPRMWEMVGGVATCKLPTPIDPAPAPAPPPPPPAPPPCGPGCMNGKTFTMRVVGGLGASAAEVYTVTGTATALTIKPSWTAACTLTGPGQCSWGSAGDPEAACPAYPVSNTGSTKVRLNANGTIDFINFWSQEVGGDAGQVYNAMKGLGVNGAATANGTTYTLSNTQHLGNCRYVVPGGGGSSDGGGGG